YQKTERWTKREQHAQVIFGACLYAAALPVPMIGHVPCKKRISHFGLEAELIARVRRHGSAIGTRDGVKDGVRTTRRPRLRVWIVHGEGRIIATHDLAFPGPQVLHICLRRKATSLSDGIER